MSNILLFFMSAYKPDVKNGAYSRAQTNETVLYELQKQKERRPDTVQRPQCCQRARAGRRRVCHDPGLLPAAGPARSRDPGGQLCLHPRARQHERGRPGQGHPGYCAEGSPR